MEPNEQKQFMYLFERVGEPLYLGPRGGESNLTYYNVPTEHLTYKEQNASIGFRSGMSMTMSMLNSPMQPTIIVDAPKSEIPDFNSFDARCPKSGLYSHFDPMHRSAAHDLKQLFMELNKKELLSMACLCRDSNKINSQLWIYSLASTILDRKDMKGFHMPPVWEIMPDQFICPLDIKKAKSQAVMPTDDRIPIEITHNFTGENTNPETKLSYFREDMGINSHHFHWHVVYALDSKPKKRDRKGELFYYMHHGMLARYDAERLANGLALVKPFNLDDDIIHEGYFPNLMDTNSGMAFGNRQGRSIIRPVTKSPGLPVGLTDLKKYLYRIFDAIDTKMVLKKGGEMIPLTTDILGDIVENGGDNYTPNKQFYGSFHNLGHFIISNVQDPTGEHKSGLGVMSGTPTAMRDPIFYRWHKLVDNIFLYWQISQDPRPYSELIFTNVEVKDIKVTTKNKSDNLLFTHWVKRQLDLSRGLDFGRTSANMLGPIKAIIKTLDHEPFTYTIIVANKGRIQLNGTIRIFMAPKMNEHNEIFKSGHQWPQFFEMDKFPYELIPGDNLITRTSDKASVAIPWEQSFEELEKMVEKMGDRIPVDKAICGCGWPQHMLLPRGTKTGMDFDLFVMVTDGSKDQVPRETKSTCRESTSYCGILDQKYPDKLPMGYPFDRPPPSFRQMTPGNDLDDFIQNVPNSKSQHIKIVHLDVDIISTGPDDVLVEISSESKSKINGESNTQQSDHHRQEFSNISARRRQPGQSPPNSWSNGTYTNYYNIG